MHMEKDGFIYLLIDGTNDMEYVGQTTQSVEERFKQHVSHKKYFIGAAIDKHGAENFVIAILKVCKTQEERNYWEKHFIKYRDTLAPNGYNLTDGGEGGWSHTPESIAKISAANSGENHPQFGKPLSDARKAKIAAGQRGKKLSDEHKAKVSAGQPNKHKVICIETKKIYDSVAAAARYFGVGRENIIKACQQHQRAVAGKHLWYLEDFNNATEIIIPPPKTKPQKRAVICLETSEVFPTIRQAAKWLGMVHGAVSRACRKHYAAGGYHFRYLDDVPEEQRAVKVNPQGAPDKTLSLKGNSHPVKCVESGEIFESVLAAARYYKINHSNIRQACRTNWRAGGLHWCFVDEQQPPQV